jgi:hypothetical protein
MKSALNVRNGAGPPDNLFRGQSPKLGQGFGHLALVDHAAR